MPVEYREDHKSRWNNQSESGDTSVSLEMGLPVHGQEEQNGPVSPLKNKPFFRFENGPS